MIISLKLFSKIYYSIGGGEVISEDEIHSEKKDEKTLPYNFTSAKELLEKSKSKQF